MENLSQQFYNLNTDPFRLFPDHRFSFFHRTYKNAFDDLQRGLDAGDGFIVITGRAGTGKTTLINETIAKLDTNKAVVATLVTTQYEAHDLLGMIASSFGLNCHKKSKSIIWLELEKFLWMRRSKGKRALLVVDEAQGLGADALEELQALSNLQDNGKPLLQIILIGREELIDLINSPELENLRKRIISSSRLEPLSESETIDYLTHRLDHAGWTGDPEITKGTGFLAHHFSGGIPSTINLVFNRLLLHGSFVEKHELNADDMKSVLEELSEERLISEKYAVTSDIEERVNILENEHIQPLNRIKNTSEPAEYPGVFNYPESTIQTDESTDKASVDNNSRVDTHDSNDESGVHTEATVFDSKTIQVPDTRKKSRWPGNYVWMSVSLAIAVAVGLKIYSGFSQDHAEIQSQADIDGKTSTAKAAKPVEYEQAKNHETASDTGAALAKITPGLTPARTVEKTLPVKTAPPVVASPATPGDEKPPDAETKTSTTPVPPVIARPATPTGEKQSDAETETSTDPVLQSLKITTAPDITDESIELKQGATQGESVLPGDAEPAPVHRSTAVPIKQDSKPPLVRKTPGVKRTTRTPTQAKTDPVIDKPEKSSIAVKKELQKAQVTSNVTEAADSASLTMDTLLATQWITDTSQQAPQLPSFITNCSAKPGSIECWSHEYFIEKNGKSVRVKTKSYLKNFTESGFTIRYKHMLLGGANEKRRWEDKTHQLDCMLIERDKIKCKEDGDNGAVIFTRNTSDQLSSLFTHTLLTSAK